MPSIRVASRICRVIIIVVREVLLKCRKGSTRPTKPRKCTRNPVNRRPGSPNHPTPSAPTSRPPPWKTTYRSISTKNRIMSQPRKSADKRPVKGNNVKFSRFLGRGNLYGLKVRLKILKDWLDWDSLIRCRQLQKRYSNFWGQIRNLGLRVTNDSIHT